MLPSPEKGLDVSLKEKVGALLSHRECESRNKFDNTMYFIKSTRDKRLESRIKTPISMQIWPEISNKTATVSPFKINP